MKEILKKIQTEALSALKLVDDEKDLENWQVS